MRGRLSIFLGYAAGVGKTYAMLEEAQKRKHQGADTVIAALEPHGRHDTMARTQGFESVPLRRMEYREGLFEEMDTEAVLARKPQIAVVDEFAHTNVPGSPRGKRWEDVRLLLDAGIDVLTTLSVQQLESLNDQIWQMTGVRVRETVPDWVVKQASEVVMVDVTPRALLNRLERGVVYPPDKARLALQNVFKESTLVALRELALRQTAHEVDLRQDSSATSAATRSAGSEKLLLFVTAHPSTAVLIRRVRRVADFLQADCLAVCVAPGGSLENLPLAERSAVLRHMSFARNLQIDTQVLAGGDTARALVEFARAEGVTQVYLTRPEAGKWQTRLRRNLVQQVVRRARDMQVTVVAERRR